jgi:hypothetical protein
MANRDADNIRRIVGVNEINKGLKDAQQRDPILGQRGLAYLAPTQGSGASGSVARGTTTSANSTDGFASGTTPAASTHQQDLQSKLEGGSATPFDAGNPDSWYWGEDNGIYDVGDLIDGTAGPALGDTNNPEFSETLLGLSGLRDCANTTDMKLLTADAFPTPDGWDDADTPPTGDDPTWENGYYWLSVWGLATPQVSLRAAAAEIEAGVANREFKEFSPAYVPGVTTSTTAVFWILPAKTSTQGFGVSRYACPSSPDICVGTAPEDVTLGGSSAAASTWPSDSTQYIKYRDGQFTTSKYEGDLGTGWEPGATYGAIEFSFDSGTRFGRAEPSANGGLNIYEIDACGGAATSGGIITSTDGNGVVTGYHDAAHLTYLRPKT